MTKKHRHFKFLIKNLIIYASILFSASTFAVPAATSNTVLILAETVSGGATSDEAAMAAAQGLDVEIVNSATWSTMTTVDFASYKAIVLGDPNCGVGTSTISAAEANASVWGPAVTGNVILVGTDPALHFQGDSLTDSGISFAASSDPGKTGAYVTLSCYYHNAPAFTPVPLLDAFDVSSFTMTGVGCFDDAHIVATHPSMTSLSDSSLSNWGCSVHEAFDSWPVSFEVLAIAQGSGTTYTATDGTVGTPYILARGVTIISDIDLNPDTAVNPVGTFHTVIATVAEDGIASVGVNVNFEVIAGPSTGASGSDFTNSAGEANFTWSSALAGIDTIEATFVDSLGRTQRSDRVTKEWIGSPPILCNAGNDFSVNEASPFGLDATGTSGGSGLLSYSWAGVLALSDPSSTAPSGIAPVVDGNEDFLFTLTVSDEAGQSESCAVFLTVIDSNLPPNCDFASASPAVLWPPNHKLVEVSVTGVVDTETSASIVITGAMQDEATVTTLGAGNTGVDVVLDGETARVRAERSGLYDGRVVELAFTATDSLGQSCTGVVTLGIPHDKKDTPIDSGLIYDATVVN